MKRPIRREVLTWKDVDRLIGELIPQFDHEYDAMLLITRGGVVPGGILAEALGVKTVLTAAVHFVDIDVPGTELLAWPNFLQFPERELLEDRRVLVVDDIWGSGRTINAVRDMVLAAGGIPYLCVLHYRPHESLFKKFAPDYYGAITDAVIIYPWEIYRDADISPSQNPSPTN